MTPEPTYYELLGIEPSATQAEVKSAFRQQAIRNHPDQGGNSTLFRMIENAYETLIDPSARNEYDRSLQSHLSSAHASANRTQSWDSPPYRGGGYDDVYDEPYPTGEQPQGNYSASAFATGVPSQAPEYLVRPGPSRIGSITFRMVYAALLVWFVAALVLGYSVIPGLGNDATISVIIACILLWIFGSFFLRLGAWILFGYALVQAHWFDAPPAVTLARIGIAFGLWLCGQWFFTFKHGDWRSLIAASVLTKLPMALRPDRRWISDDYY